MSLSEQASLISSGTGKESSQKYALVWVSNLPTNKSLKDVIFIFLPRLLSLGLPILENP